MRGNGSNFENLNDTNWSTWRILMKAFLVKKNLWEVVEGSETLPAGSPNTKPVRAFRRKQAEAIAEITLHVEVPQLSFIRDDDPAVVWDELAAIHQARGMATRLSLRRRFWRLQLRENDSMQFFISSARRLATQLTEIGFNVDDEDLILVLTGGLPPSYENFVVTLDATPPSLLTLDYVITRLLNEETRQNGNTSRAEPENIAMAVMPARRKPRDISQITCFNCAEKGHYQSNCPKPKKSQKPETVAIAIEDNSDSEESFTF
jgi:gag-polypeptide of LTR copia-type/Domain of unknown function (DUF4219)/Zinc knuckle